MGLLLEDVPGEMNIRREDADETGRRGRIGVVQPGAGCAGGVRESEGRGASGRQEIP
jgi:hypothetical protein